MYVPIRLLCDTVANSSTYHRKEGIPLFQHISENIHRLGSNKKRQEVLDFEVAFEDLRNVVRK